jgi:quinol monooxygenase YgiN
MPAMPMMPPTRLGGGDGKMAAGILQRVARFRPRRRQYSEQSLRKMVLFVGVISFWNHAMTHIRKGANPITLINVFTVSPDKADELVELLDEATDTVMKRQPGFVSANIHKSLSGKHVTNYAQWRSKQDFETMQKNPEAREHMGAAAKLAEKFEPELYTVVSVHG